MPCIISPCQIPLFDIYLPLSLTQIFDSIQFDLLTIHPLPNMLNICLPLFLGSKLFKYL